MRILVVDDDKIIRMGLTKIWYYVNILDIKNQTFL